MVKRDLPDVAVEAIARAANVTHRRYKTYFDVEDVRQDLYEWLLRRPKKVAEWCDLTLSADEQKQQFRAMQKSLMRQADRICRSLKAQALGYSITDEQFYPIPVLEELLPLAFGELAEARHPAAGTASGGGDPSTRGNFVTSLIDVRRALDSLDPSEYLLLVEKFMENRTYAQIAENYGLSESTASRRIHSALKHMSAFLGGDDPYNWRRRPSKAVTDADL